MPFTDKRSLTAALVLALALVVTAVLARGHGDAILDVEYADAWPDSGNVTLLIDLSDHLSQRRTEELLAELPEGTTLNSIYSEREGLYRVDLPVAEARALAERLQGDPRIEFVEPSMEFAATPDPGVPWNGTVLDSSGSPNDPLYQFQWHFDQIDVEGAWTRARGDDIVVAIIDTGVAYADDDNRGYRMVQDLGGTGFVDGYDFVDDDDNPYDLHGHGTHVAGTVAQTTNNGYGVAGAAPGARIMPLRVLDAAGRGSTADIADAIRFAADNGADVINMSLGGPMPSRVMGDAIRYAHRRGVTIVAAAGNSGWSMPSFPAAYNHVIAVSATQYDRNTTFYSNYGRYVDIAAPGGNTRLDQNGDGQPDGVMQETLARGNPNDHEFGLYMGTSMASPHVAAVAALVESMGVSHPDRVEEILLETASQEVPTYDQARYGAGLLDAAAATRYPLTRYQVPRAILALLLVGLIVLIARRKDDRKPSGFAAATTAILAASGLSLVTLALSMLGISTATLGPLSTSVVQWPATLGLGGVTHSALFMSAGPILLLYAVFGGTRRPIGRGLLLGTMLGLTAYLMAETFAPLANVGLVPGLGFMDQLWLGTNAFFALIISIIAARSNR